MVSLLKSYRTRPLGTLTRSVSEGVKHLRAWTFPAGQSYAWRRAFIGRFVCSCQLSNVRLSRLTLAALPDQIQAASTTAACASKSFPLIGRSRDGCEVYHRGRENLPFVQTRPCGRPRPFGAGVPASAGLLRLKAVLQPIDRRLTCRLWFVNLFEKLESRLQPVLSA